MKIRIEFKPQDLWVGLYWERKATVKNVTAPYFKPDRTLGETTFPRQFGRGLHIWICFVPMLPLHIEVPQ